MRPHPALPLCCEPHTHAASRTVLRPARHRQAARTPCLPPGGAVGVPEGCNTRVATPLGCGPPCSCPTSHLQTLRQCEPALPNHAPISTPSAPPSQLCNLTNGATLTRPTVATCNCLCQVTAQPSTSTWPPPEPELPTLTAYLLALPGLVWSLLWHPCVYARPSSPCRQHWSPCPCRCPSPSSRVAEVDRQLALPTCWTDGWAWLFRLVTKGPMVTEGRMMDGGLVWSWGQAC